MTIRRRTKSSSRAARATRPIPVNQTTIAPLKRVKPPLVEQFHVAVDRQLKSGHGTCEAAAKVALAIKKRYPHLQVTVYDAKETYDHRTAKGWRRPIQKILSPDEQRDLSTAGCRWRQALIR
jgi:hypothetical protein